jgi:hypothetical protein
MADNQTLIDAMQRETDPTRKFAPPGTMACI